jgi:hypothetical protein
VPSVVAGVRGVGQLFEEPSLLVGEPVERCIDLRAGPRIGRLEFAPHQRFLDRTPPIAHRRSPEGL